MGFIEISEKMLNIAFTENGDKAYHTSGSYCLDYFALVGGMRFNLSDALNAFLLAYYEDKILAIKILFFTRDIRDGLGERDIFRYTFNTLSNIAPNIARQLLSYIPIYGRYDDLFAAFYTPLKKDVVKIIKETLNKDIEAKNKGESISLLAKWMPSINTSSFEVRKLASDVAVSLNMSKEEYRKTLSFLRKGLIIENNLREKDYTFDYSKVSGNAMAKYIKAFFRNDNARYNEYLSSVQEGKTKINSSTIYPYEVIRKLENNGFYYNEKLSEEEINSLDVIWKSFSKDSINKKTIVVRDGSGSMVDNRPVSASSVATSLAILFAERLEGEFHNKFITFSSRPQLISIKGNTIKEKFDYISRYSDYTNTDIEKVYNLILDVYSHKDFKKEDALDQIVIISDMEFDEGVDTKSTTYETFKSKFNKLGYEMPNVVFWNVRARNAHLPVIKGENNVTLVSGASANVIDMITEGNMSNPYDLMIEILEKYKVFDSINI